MIQIGKSIRVIFERLPAGERVRSLAPGEAAFACILGWIGAVVFALALHRYSGDWLPQSIQTVTVFAVVLVAVNSINGKNQSDDAFYLDHSAVVQVATIVALGPMVGGGLMMAVALLDAWIHSRTMRWTEHVNNIALTAVVVSIMAACWSEMVIRSDFPSPLALVVMWVIFTPLTTLVAAVYARIVGDNPGELIRFMVSQSAAIVDEVFLGIIVVLACSRYPFLIIGVFTAALASRIAERRKHELESTKQELSRDALTGLFTRRALMEYLDELFDVGSGTVLIGDIDNFKKLNDTLGHVEGDRALVSVARELQRIDDRLFVARFGGEEMVAIARVNRIDEAVAIGERMLSAARAGLHEWGTSMSIGVAIFDGDGSIKEWIDRADQALYASKHGGKNQVNVSLGLDAEIVSSATAVDFVEFRDGGEDESRSHDAWAA